MDIGRFSAPLNKKILRFVLTLMLLYLFWAENLGFRRKMKEYFLRLLFLKYYQEILIIIDFFVNEGWYLKTVYSV